VAAPTASINATWIAWTSPTVPGQNGDFRRAALIRAHATFPNRAALAASAVPNTVSALSHSSEKIHPLDAIQTRVPAGMCLEAPSRGWRFVFRRRQPRGPRPEPGPGLVASRKPMARNEGYVMKQVLWFAAVAVAVLLTIPVRAQAPTSTALPTEYSGPPTRGEVVVERAAQMNRDSMHHDATPSVKPPQGSGGDVGGTPLMRMPGGGGAVSR
jgi:hypothetical protein